MSWLWTPNGLRSCMFRSHENSGQLNACRYTWMCTATCVHMHRSKSFISRVSYTVLFLLTFLSSTLQRDTIHAASRFAARNQLPEQIRDEMLAHICLRYKTEGLKQKETLDSLPKAIRSSIACHLFLPVLEKIYLFDGVSFTCRLQLVWT